MREEIIFTMKSPYRQDFEIKGYHFGSGKKSVCIMGALRGNEIQQLYIASTIIKHLKEYERLGQINDGYEILVIPTGNPYSINIGKRFWAVDNTDINRMFPGYNEGETTQRIANDIFEAVKDYEYGIHLTSFYLKGDFMPHVRMMKTGYEDVEIAKDFEMKYVCTRTPSPIDTTTLNYNWQIWDVKAFSLYTNKTDVIDERAVRETVDATLRFLKARGIINAITNKGYISTVLDEDELITIKATQAGIYKGLKNPGESVFEGEVLAQVIDPFTTEIIEEIKAPECEVIFFAHEGALITEQTVVSRIIKLSCI